MLKKTFCFLIAAWSCSVQAEPLVNLGINYAEIPPSFEVLSPSKLISKIQVDFNSSEVNVGATDGYTVTDPFGNTFVVDNIQEPTYAFYATYIDTSDDNGLYDAPEVNTQVYIENLNFGNF